MKWVFALVVVACIVFGNAFLIFSHEQAHQQIYRNYGVASEIRFGLFWAGTFAEQPVALEDQAVVQVLHAMNEVMGYQVIAMFNAIVLVLFATLFLVDFQTI